MTRQLETGDRVGFAPAWLRRQRERWEPLTGQPFPLNETHRGKVEWVLADSCLRRPVTRAQVVWEDERGFRWCNVLPASALRRVPDSKPAGDPVVAGVVHKLYGGES